MAAGLRLPTERERSIVGEHSAKHGRVVGFKHTVSDDVGAISAPLLRLGILDKLALRGAIGSAEVQAGERFARLFRVATLDPLKAADLSRIPMPAGTKSGDLPASAERCRREISELMRLLGGAASPAAGVAWHVLGCEMTLRAWALSTQRRHETATGILIAALGTLAGHFGERRQRRA